MQKNSLPNVWIAIIIIVLLAVAGVLTYQFLGKQEEEVKTPEKKLIDKTIGWTVYQNGVFGYSFKYPGDKFKVEEGKDIEGEEVTSLKAKEIIVSTCNIPGIEIKVGPLNNAWHLKGSMIWTYGAAQKEPSSQVIDCEVAKKNVTMEDIFLEEDIEAIKIYNKEGIINWYTPYRYSFFFTAKDRAFIISFIQPEDYPTDYLPIFEQILSTFKVL